MYVGMAFESIHWRRIIIRDIKYILRKIELLQKNDIEYDDLERVYSMIEIKIFAIAYAFRKLLNLQKIPHDAIGNVLCRSHQRLNREVKWSTFLFYDGGYNLEKGKKTSKSFKYICNQIIHSEIFQLTFIKNKKPYLYVNSASIKHKEILCFDLVTFLKQSEDLVMIYPSFVISEYDKNSNQYLTKTYSKKAI